MKNFCIPLKNGVPIVKWGQYEVGCELPSCEGYDEFALLCGEVSGIIGLDIDSDAEEAKIMALVDGEKLRAKRGSKGRTIFFKYSGERSRSWKKDGKVVLELLSDKKLTTIPPSKHRDAGKPAYVWINETAILIEFPAHLIAVFDALYPAPKREEMAFTSTDNYEKVDASEAEEMLGYVSPDCSREEWLRVGMALRDEFGDFAFSVWDSWSAGSAKYKQREMHSIWRSFNGQGVGIGTLIYYAQQGGWIKKYLPVEHDHWEIDLSYLDVKQRKEIVAHGLVGDIAKWITETAPLPQPILALGAALTFVGMLKGHKYCTSTGLRTNILTMNIAPSSSGKDYPQKCVRELARKMGLGKHIMGKPTSGTGLITGLQKADCVGFLRLDELGRYLSVAMNDNAGGYQKEIISYVIELFSCANDYFEGKQYASDKVNPQMELIQPHLCVLGSSVKHRIVESCTSGEAIDGFLNRWILFETENEPARNKNIHYKIDPPQHIIDQIQKILDDDQSGKYGVIEGQEPIVKEVRYTPEAYQIMDSFLDEAHELKIKTPDPLKALYGRISEHTPKIALTLCDNEFIRAEDVLLAIEIVTESNKLIADFAGLIADNEQEKNVLRVLSIIKSYAHGIMHGDLTKRTRFLSGRVRKEIVSDLVQSGEVAAQEVGKTFKYIAV
jgi:hypothetical protein